MSAPGQRDADAGKRQRGEPPGVRRLGLRRLGLRRPGLHVERDPSGGERHQRDDRSPAIGGRKPGHPDARLPQIRQRQAQHVDALQSHRHDGSHKPAFQRDRDGSARAWGERAARDPGGIKMRPHAAEQTDVQHKPGEPDRRAQGTFGIRRRARRRRGLGRDAWRTDRKRQRAADRMTVERDHAPAHEMRAAHERSRQRRDKRVARRGDVREVRRVSARPDQAQRERRHRLVEGELQRHRRTRDNHAIRRLAADERGVRQRVASG